jgi:hypothetical protein
MAELRTQSSETETDPGDQDFKLIHGIGPGIETRLHAAGIHTFEQLAALTPEDITARVGHLIGMSTERVKQQDWIGQAHQLVKETGQVGHDLAASNSHQHYGSFSIELLLDQNNTVRRTKVLHVQSMVEDAWAGWEDARLLNFIKENADLNLMTQSEALFNEPEKSIPESATISPQKMGPSNFGFAGQMHMADMVVEVAEKKGGQHFIYSSQPFTIILTLDLTDLQVPRDTPFGYSATIYAKKVGGGSRQVIGSSTGEFLPNDKISLDVSGIQLSSGVYRMEAFVELMPPVKSPKPVQGLMAMSEGSLLHIL